MPDVGGAVGTSSGLVSELGGKIAALEGPPFTLQRLCEVIAFPGRHYKQRRKLLSAVDRVRIVLSVSGVSVYT